MCELHFDERGHLTDGSALPMLAGASAVLVLSHGWNNSADEARELYHGLERELGRFGTPPPVIGVFWPSKKFDSVLGAEFDAALDSPMARQVLVGAMRAAVPQEPAPSVFHMLPVEILLRRLAGSQPLREGLLNLSNLTTFYQMKERAGIIGRTGLAPVLDEISHRYPKVRIHLAGHSFGARLVTAAADAVDNPVQSLALLQGAFSHHGFAKSINGVAGAFRNVIARCKVQGPLVVTHTRNDQAVGLAYALASRVAGQEAAFLGDSNDRFGGIGSNGAVRTSEAIQRSLLPARAEYNFQSGKIHNFKADAFIRSHSDILNPEVAWLIQSVLSA